jgi:hypothetical protein
MRRIIISISGLAFILMASIHAHHAAVPLTINDSNSVNGLSVTGEVLSKKCLSWNKNLVELQIRLRLTNSSRRSLIINKRDLEIIKIKYFAIIDEIKDQVHLGELAVERLRDYLPEYDREIVGMRPNNHFVVLRPRQSYVIEITESVSVPLIPATPNIPATDQPDEYQIEVEVATWVNHAPALADSLRRRWQRVGVFWTNTVWSAPIKFTFPRARICETARASVPAQPNNSLNRSAS